MKPVDFPGSNVKIAEHQPEYLTLPAHIQPDATGSPTVFCWQLDGKDLADLKENGGRIWQRVLTFGQPLQPQGLEVATDEAPPEGVPSSPCRLENAWRETAKVWAPSNLPLFVYSEKNGFATAYLDADDGQWRECVAFPEDGQAFNVFDPSETLDDVTHWMGHPGEPVPER